MNEKKGFLSLFNCPSKSIWLHNTFFYGLHKSYLPAQRSIISFGSSIFTVIIMPILPKNLFRWSSGPPFSVDEIRMKVYYLNASFLWLALPNPILACGNVIRISSPKLFFSMKARDGKCCSKFCLIPFHEIYKHFCNLLSLHWSFPSAIFFFLLLSKGNEGLP